MQFEQTAFKHVSGEMCILWMRLALAACGVDHGKSSFYVTLMESPLKENKETESRGEAPSLGSVPPASVTGQWWES